VGKVAPLGIEGVPSAFVKHAYPGPVRVTPSGIVGDEQADLSVHGGPDKAVYAYGLSHYATWRHEYPQHGHLLIPGGLGENLGIEGITEADLCVGDVHAIGTTRERPNPAFPFTRLVELISRGKATTADWIQMRHMPGLALDWQQRAEEMLMRRPKD
jgi:hypothetical protein